MEKLLVQFSLGDPDGNSRCGLVYKYSAHGGKTKIYFPPLSQPCEGGLFPEGRAGLVGCGGLRPAPAFSRFCCSYPLSHFLPPSDSEGSWWGRALPWWWLGLW